MYVYTSDGMCIDTRGQDTERVSHMRIYIPYIGWWFGKHYRLGVAAAHRPFLLRMVLGGLLFSFVPSLPFGIHHDFVPL